MPIYGKIMIIKKNKQKKQSFSSKPRIAQMMILSLVAMTGLEKCCIASAYLQWLIHSGEQAVAHGPLVINIDVCINIMEIWFEIANGQILSILDLSAHLMIVVSYYCFTVVFIRDNFYNCLFAFLQASSPSKEAYSKREQILCFRIDFFCQKGGKIVLIGLPLT